MKTNRKVISGSSILTMLGVVCFATVLVAAAVLSNTVNTPSKDVAATEITLSLEGSGVGTGDDWATAPAYGGDSYYQNVKATFNSYSGDYFIYVQVKEGDAVIDSAAWAFKQAVDGDTEVPMTYNVASNTWHSASPITPSDVSDALLFNFVCGAEGYSANGVTLNFEAHSVAPE